MNIKNEEIFDSPEQRFTKLRWKKPKNYFLFKNFLSEYKSIESKMPKLLSISLRESIWFLESN